jgi:RNA polymerase sigma-70 factor (ECF subfamily)
MTTTEPATIEATTRTASQPVGTVAIDLAAFVAEHYDRLLRLALLVCRDVPDAADAVQAGLEQAWRHRDSLRDATRAKAWLDRIVVREAIHVDRRRRSVLRILAMPREIPVVDPTDHRAALMPDWSAMRIAFDRLSPEQRAVIALHLHAGYSVADTAAMVGAPEETVRSRLRLAKERLRRELEDSIR